MERASQPKCDAKKSIAIKCTSLTGGRSWLHCKLATNKQLLSPHVLQLTSECCEEGLNLPLTVVGLPGVSWNSEKVAHQSHAVAAARHVPQEALLINSQSLALL